MKAFELIVKIMKNFAADKFSRELRKEMKEEMEQDLLCISRHCRNASEAQLHNLDIQRECTEEQRDRIDSIPFKEIYLLCAEAFKGEHIPSHAENVAYNMLNASSIKTAKEAVRMYAEYKAENMIAIY